jgi:large subunit ribosomal protein L5
MGAVQQEIWRDRLMAYIPRLKKYYRDNVIPAMKKRFNYPNVMMVPRLEKIVVNVGVGEASQNPKLLDSVSAEIGLITGLRPALTRAKKSISNFKLRQGMPIGCFVTLRRNHMYEFLDRLINVAIPRIRDFRGLSDRSFDGRGNYSLGIREQIIFPEIDYDKIDKIRGMNITIVTTAKTDEEALELLREFGVPFRRRAEAETTTEAA